MNISICPILSGFLSLVVALLPEDDDLELRRAAVECFGKATPGDVELARARCVIEYAVKTCLPRGFDMFGLPDGRVTLSTLPVLSANTFDVYMATFHRKLVDDNEGEGESLMRGSLLRPIAAVRQALEQLQAGLSAEVCQTLEPIIERLSGSEELLPMLDKLLLFTPEYPTGRPSLEVSQPPRLGYGFIFGT